MSDKLNNPELTPRQRDIATRADRKGEVDAASVALTPDLATSYLDGERWDEIRPPSIMSGEWTGESMPELLGDDFTYDDVELYQDVYDDAWHEEMHARCKRMVGR